jgi:radical SAM protein with 4Fe4S-binding SPASM domain
MKAINVDGQAPGGKRSLLKDIVPLKTPLIVQLFPVYACNFKCNYCIFQIPKKDRHFISDDINMNFDLYKKFVKEMCNFPDRIKTFRFVGIGEPLLHKNIVEMVKLAYQYEIANTIEILTNASLLTKSMSKKLIRAGLNRLVISLQGLTTEKYNEMCSTTISFETIVDNIKYFYDNKKDCHIYVKIVDEALDGENDKQKFYEIFGDICDSLSVEHTVPIHTEIGYSDSVASKQMSQFGLPIKEVSICPQPFIHMQINPDCKVVPCYSFDYPEILGDCNNENIIDIWNGKKFNEFRHQMLQNTKNINAICEKCTMIKYRWFEEDDLTDKIKELKEYYGKSL